MKMGVRQISLFVMLLLIANISLFAYDFESNGVYFNVKSLDDMSCVVTCGENNDGYSGIVNIPSSVTYKNREFSVVGIDKRAFKNCVKLCNVDIPETVISIGDEAFYGCSLLERINLPLTLTEWGESAFNGCTKLHSLDIPTGVWILPEKIFYECSALEEISIPCNVTLISDDAFAFSGVKKCVIEDSDNRIELKGSNISLGYFDKIFHISGGAFSNTSIEYLYLGRNYELRTGYYSNTHSPFFGVETIEEVIIGEKVSSIPVQTFVTHRDYRTSTTAGYDWDYKTCPNFTNFTVLSGPSLSFVQEVNYGKGYNDYENIKNLNLNRNIDYSALGIYAYTLFSKLENVVLDGDFTSINSDLFYECSNLSSIEISNRVTDISYGAFYGTKNLKSIFIKAITPPSFKGDPGFSDKQFMDASVFVPQTSLEAYKNADIWKNFWNIAGSDFSKIENVEIDNPGKAFIITQTGITALTNGIFDVYSLNGYMIKSCILSSGESIDLSNGVYLVSFNGLIVKILIK